MIDINQKQFILFIFIIFSSINYYFCQEKESLGRCGADDIKLKHIFAKRRPLNKSQLSKRKLDSDGFQDFHIYFDPANLKHDFELNPDFAKYEDLIFNGINKAIATLQKLLKVKPPKYSYSFSVSDFYDIGINNLSESNVVYDEDYEEDVYQMNEYNLILFGTLQNLGSVTLASAGAYHTDYDGLPITGIVYINNNKDYTSQNSQEYFDSIILHEFTHVLGFSKSYFEDNEMIFYIVFII